MVVKHHFSILLPLQKTAKRSKSRYRSPSTGFQPMSAYPLESSNEQLCKPQLAKYCTTYSNTHILHFIKHIQVNNEHVAGNRKWQCF